MKRQASGPLGINYACVNPRLRIKSRQGTVVYSDSIRVCPLLPAAASWVALDRQMNANEALPGPRASEQELWIRVPSQATPLSYTTKLGPFPN
jgi:hypothetical protein